MKPNSPHLILFVLGTILATIVGRTDAVQTLSPAPEMQKLIDVMQGEWSLKETYEPSELMPTGGTGQSKESWRAGPGGHSLVEDYHSKTAAAEISGISVTWWDGKARAYQAIWCSNTLPGCVSLTGRWEGEDLVLTSQFERGGKKFDFREVLSEFTPTSFTQKIYQGEAGGELKLIMTMRATKKPTD